ncbi:STE/STE7/MEK1 protein kinase [Mycena chlorophos]|uniref:STE/STE7/MEK1 protein kinase n=1 Tax=Mycena chlorophos TaxID=658473 RepID=A0A8H6SIC0_MYCCL|nr:STE/STE7/MEK1 protein kinase [Mycena chlorophos]
MSIRKKRNFRDLQLPVGSLSLNDAGRDEQPVATRLAPLGPRAQAQSTGKPAPLPLRDGANLVDGTGATLLNVASPQSAASSLSSTLAALDARNTKKREFDLKNDDFTSLAELGSGNGGCVMKVQHVRTGTIMAKKVVLIDAKPAERKKILLELQIMHDCDSSFIVSSYGAYLAEPNICLCMEYMDKGSFDAIYKRMGPIDVRIVGKVAVAVLEGQRYLYDVHRIIHRDIKPSNILLNSQGEIKLCDFGVSGELINSIANTFVGTSIYMSPERIQGATYSVKSDIWSLGITLIELTVGQFPFSGSFDSDNDSDLENEHDHPSLLFANTDTSGDKTPAPPDPNGHRASLTIPSDLPAAKRRSRRRSKGVSLHGGGMTISIIELMHQIVERARAEAAQGQDGEKRTGLTGLFEMRWIQDSRANGMDVAAWTKTF